MQYITVLIIINAITLSHKMKAKNQKIQWDLQMWLHTGSRGRGEEYYTTDLQKLLTLILFDLF